MKHASITKTIALALLVFLCVPLFAACGSAGTESDGSGTPSGGKPGAAETPEEAPETEAPAYPVPLSDYGGYTFTFLNEEDDFWQGANHILDYDALTGEALADAVFNRNRKAESDLNLKFAVEKASLGSGDAMYERMQKTVLAMDDTYDVVYICLDWNGQTTYPGGLTVNLHTVGSLQLDREWWNQSFIRSATVREDILFTTIDYVNLMSVSYCNSLFCNKQFVRQYGLEYPYEAVKNGEWTYDRMFAMIDQVKNIGTQDTWAPDLSGDAIYGLVGQHAETTVSLLQGCGVLLISKDDANRPAITEDIGRLIDAYDKLMNALSEDGSCMLVNQTGCQGLDFFNNNRALFYGSAIGHGSGARMRSSDVEYGALPQPKADETQKEYCTPLSQYTLAMNIPKSASDPERTGAVMDYLDWLSYRECLPILMTNMCYKGVSDPQDIEMITVALEAEVIDIGQIIECTGEFMTTQCGPDKMLAGSNTFTSDWAAQTKVINKKLSKLFTDGEG